jgi:thiamine kinase-like enzyme
MFTYLLRNFKANGLEYTLPQFHDLNLRYKQFEKSLKSAGEERLSSAADSLAQLRSHQEILDRYNYLTGNSLLPLRVIHHDTKISNVLFDKDSNGLCVIDLDTVMPGYFISDVGDMLRTYLSPANEEETDLSSIKIDTDRFYAIYNGYMSAMGNELTAYERENFFYSGKFMTYMQALRFMTDYLNNDVYYHTTYRGQNLNRAKNQLALLDELLMLEKDIQPLLQK